MPVLGDGRRPSVGLVGDLDLSTIDQAEALIRDVLRSPPSELVIDMGLVTFFGAAGVRLLAKLLEEGIEVELVDAPAQVRKVIRICELTKHPRLRFHDSSGDQLELTVD